MRKMHIANIRAALETMQPCRCGGPFKCIRCLALADLDALECSESIAAEIDRSLAAGDDAPSCANGCRGCESGIPEEQGCLSADKRVVEGPLVFCLECDTLYRPLPGQTSVSPLPCGHKGRVIAMPSFLFSALRDSQLVNWADRNGLLAEIIGELQEAGGDFDPCGCGPVRLTLPKED